MKKIPLMIGGLALIVIAVAGFWILGNILNPPAQEIIIATSDLNPGDTLSPEKIQVASVQIGRRMLENYLTPATVEAQGFNLEIVQPVAEGNFIPLSALLFADNPKAAEHTALGLDHEDVVAMVIPVSPLTCPTDIKAGDMVDITMDVGSAAFMTGVFGNAPTPQPYSPYTSARPDIGSGQLPTIQSPVLAPLPSSTSEGLITLPVTKTIARAKVLDIHYELRFGGTLSGDQQTEKGEIIALVVGVPSEAKEIIGFAIHNGEVRIAVLSPKAGEEMVSAGMSYDDLVAYFKWNRELWLMDQTLNLPYLEAPGSAVIYPTLMATYYPSPTPRPTHTPTATPEITGTPDSLEAQTTPTPEE